MLIWHIPRQRMCNSTLISGIVGFAEAKNLRLHCENCCQKEAIKIDHLWLILQSPWYILAILA